MFICFITQRYAPNKKPIEKLNIQFIEVLLLIFHHLAFKSSSASKEATGIFTPLGQPGEDDPVWSEKKADFLTNFSFILESESSFLKAVSEAIEAESKEASKSDITPEEKESKVVSFSCYRFILTHEMNRKIEFLHYRLPRMQGQMHSSF